MPDVNWWELPDGTLVRDSKGDLRLVRHGNGLYDRPQVWLMHWSDEYSPVHDDEGLHTVASDKLNDGSPVTVVPLGGKVTLRTNEDDWRELATDGLGDIAHAGHDVPEFVWLDLLRAAGVEVEIVTTDFEVNG